MPMDVHLDDGSITGPDGLLERLQTLTDPRARRGKRHRLAGLLAIAAAAVLGGARSYTAIAEFASELDAATLARLGTWRRPYSDCWIPPSEATLRRTLQQVDADALDRLVGDWLADQQPPAQAGDQPAAVAVDGKALRGAVGPDGQRVPAAAGAAGPPRQGGHRRRPAHAGQACPLAGRRRARRLPADGQRQPARPASPDRPAGPRRLSPRRTTPLTAATAASSTARSRPPPRPPGCGSPTPSRWRCCNATPPTWPATLCAPRSPTPSPAWTPPAPAPPGCWRWPAANGRSRTACTGSAT